MLLFACRPEAPPSSPAPALDSTIPRQPTAAGPLIPPSVVAPVSASSPSTAPGPRVAPDKFESLLKPYLSIGAALARGKTAGIDPPARKLARAAMEAGLREVSAAATRLARANLVDARAAYREISVPLAAAVQAEPNVRALYAVARCGAATWVQMAGEARDPYRDPSACAAPVFDPPP